MVCKYTRSAEVLNTFHSNRLHHRKHISSHDGILTASSLTRSSYYNPDYRTGAALLRARRPYLVKNTLTGVVIFGFAIGVCMSC